MLSRQPYSRLAASLGTATRSPLLQAPPRPYSSSTSSSSSSVNVKTAFVSVALLTSAYLLYQYESSSGSDSFSLPGHKSTFKVNIRTGRGGLQTYEFPRKPADQVERELREHESSQTVGRKGNPVVRWDSNWVGSNEPCEDRSAADLVSRERERRLVQEAVGFWKGWYKGDAIDVSASASASALTREEEGEGEGKGDWMLFSIMDGHAGDATSSLLAKTLHPTLSMALASLQAGNPPARQNDGWGWGRWAWGWLGLGNDVWTPENVSKTIENAYVVGVYHASVVD